MPDIRQEITAAGAAYDALANLPADQRHATLNAVRHQLDTRDMQQALDDAETAGLIENAD